MRAWLVLPLALLAGAAAAQDEVGARLTTAKAQSAAASARAEQLDRAANAATDPARQAQYAEAALAARVSAAQADIAAAEARGELVARLVAAERRRLAASQAPVARLLAALQSLAGRPPVVAIAQPGTVDDLVHVRAVLGSTIPAIRARTTEVRAELDRARGLQRSATLAAEALRDGRARLEANRLALVRLEAEHRLGAPGRGGLYESDRALALGEQSRDIVGLMATIKDAAEVEASLASLPGPLPRPGATAAAAIPRAYRLPAAGRIVVGFGEISDTGVRSRGLTLATAPLAPVVAPAGGRIAYAGRFRQYGLVVVIDHGEGWATALTGLGEAEVRRGDRVSAGDLIGHAPADDPRITAELRRRGRPVEPAALIG